MLALSEDSIFTDIENKGYFSTLENKRSSINTRAFFKIP